MVDNRLRDYIEVCPKCGYNHAAKSGKKFKCKNYVCQHVFNEGETEYRPPKEKSKYLFDLDSLIVEKILDKTIKDMKGIYKKDGIVKIIRITLKEKFGCEDEDLPNTATIGNRIKSIFNNFEYKGVDKMGKDGKMEKFYFVTSRQHY